jgi:hypothetical protein
MGCPQKQSPPYIRIVQHTVLSVAGLKGTMSEFELNLLRLRSREAIRQKARRGELQFLLPVGFCWNASGKIEKDPDQRVQQAIQLVFGKLEELGSVRQTLLWLRQQNISIPVLPRDPGEAPIIWKLPVYRQIWAIHQSFLRRRLRLWQKGGSHQHRGRSGTEEQRALKTAIHVDCLDSRPPFRVR